jgi:hypothetical protein
MDPSDPEFVRKTLEIVQDLYISRYLSGELEVPSPSPATHPPSTTKAYCLLDSIEDLTD